MAIPESVRGIPVIATNKKIPLIIMNRPDDHFNQDIGGYGVIDLASLTELIRVYNERK